MAIGASVVLGAAGVLLRDYGATDQGVVAITAPDLVEEAPADAIRAARRERYPFAVIADGAHSQAELKKAMSDPIVQAHYAGFDLERTRVVRLKRPAMAHVSYRQRDRIFWTRRPVVIPVGETVLTDGVHVARTRCGNRLNDIPGTVSADEPAITALDMPLRGPLVRPLAGLTLGTSSGAPAQSAGSGQGLVGGAGTSLHGGAGGAAGSSTVVAAPDDPGFGTPGNRTTGEAPGSPGHFTPGDSVIGAPPSDPPKGTGTGGSDLPATPQPPAPGGPGGTPPVGNPESPGDPSALPPATDTDNPADPPPATDDDTPVDLPPDSDDETPDPDDETPDPDDDPPDADDETPIRSVPEPGVTVLMILALGGIAARRLRA